MIREAIKNKEIKLLHKLAKSFNMSFTDFNKFSCGLKIEGNEEFINKLIEISKKIIK